jgi:TonB family protein
LNYLPGSIIPFNGFRKMRPYAFMGVCLLLLVSRGLSIAASSTEIASVNVQTVRIGDTRTVPAEMVIAPRLIRYRDPVYTDEALMNGVRGSVTFEARFDTEGKFEVLRMLDGLGFGLDERALEAIRQWRFAPATRNGVPVMVIARIEVEFKDSGRIREIEKLRREFIELEEKVRKAELRRELQGIRQQIEEDFRKASQR